MTQVHPAAKAAPTFRVIMALGKFLCSKKVYLIEAEQTDSKPGIKILVVSFLGVY